MIAINENGFNFEYMETFSDRLQEVMKLRKFDQSALASWLRVDPSTVSRWLDRTSHPRPKSHEAISRALGVKPAWLFEGVGEMQDAMDDADMDFAVHVHRHSLTEAKFLMKTIATQLRHISEMPIPSAEQLRAIAFQMEMLSDANFS